MKEFMEIYDKEKFYLRRQIKGRPQAAKGVLD
jgi:hypothetical protein